jgi:hypothetical protein
MNDLYLSYTRSEQEHTEIKRNYFRELKQIETKQFERWKEYETVKIEREWQRIKEMKAIIAKYYEDCK